MSKTPFTDLKSPYPINHEDGKHWALIAQFPGCWEWHVKHSGRMLDGVKFLARGHSRTEALAFRMALIVMDELAANG